MTDACMLKMHDKNISLMTSRYEFITVHDSTVASTVYKINVNCLSNLPYYEVISHNKGAYPKVLDFDYFGEIVGRFRAGKLCILPTV